jgi:hypothetical protein
VVQEPDAVVLEEGRRAEEELEDGERSAWDELAEGLVASPR